MNAAAINDEWLSELIHRAVRQTVEIMLDRPPDKFMLTPAEMGAILGKSTKALSNLRSRGRGPKWKKIGGAVYYFPLKMEPD